MLLSLGCFKKNMLLSKHIKLVYRSNSLCTRFSLPAYKAAIAKSSNLDLITGEMKF